MLTNLLVHSLAVVAGLGSLTLYLAAFFFPEVHRRHDFFWSGVGFFYALVLWFGAESMDASELLGHGASVSLLGWLGWQTLILRRKRTPVALQTPYTSDSWPNLRRETLTLVQDFINQTALGRWITRSARSVSPTVDQTQGIGGLRTSSLKQVDYEFLDDLAEGAFAPGRESPNLGLKSISETDSIQAVRSQKSLSSVKLGTQPGITTSEPGLVGLSQQRRSPLSWRQRGQALKDWIGDLWRSLTAPKPKRAVIEIPPREPTDSSSARLRIDAVEVLENEVLTDQPGDPEPPVDFQDSPSSS